MRKLLITLLFSFLFTNIFAQTQDLFALAQGEYLGMNPLYDEDENIFGYISIYNYGKSGPRTKKFEYVILDKNLNPFANNTFEGDITAGDYYGYIRFDGTVILQPSSLDYSHLDEKDMYSPGAMVIDLESNTVKKKVYYEYDHDTFRIDNERNSWKEYKKEYKDERKENGYNYVSSITEIKEGGYLVSSHKEYKRYIGDNTIRRFNEEKELMWEYKYNKNASKKSRELFYYLAKDEDYLYGFLRTYSEEWEDDYDVSLSKKNINDFFRLLVLDMKTGKEVHKKYIEDPEEILPLILDFPTYGYGSIDNSKIFDDKIVLVGRMNENGLYTTGITRVIIDKQTFDTDLKTLSYQNDFKPYIPKINASGRVEKGYYIDVRDIFFLKNGSVSILFEKYKPPTEYTVAKTTDLIYLYTDKDFKISGTKIFEKEKSKLWNTDYLFSQNLNNGDDLVFFYRDLQKDDETREKNWNLFINTYINGEFKQEAIPISSKENYLIIPYIAKEGYILLQEFNKEAKYNQIRLERLNY